MTASLFDSLARTLLRTDAALVPDVVECLERTAALSAEELRAEQLGQLRRVVAVALGHVPYYRETLGVLRNTPPAAFGWDAFRELPVIEREVLRDHAAALVNQRASAAHRPIAASSTSGSTGKPLRTERSRAMLALFEALRLRFHRWQGRELGLRAAFVSAVHEVGRAEPPAGARLGPWAAGGTGEGHLLSLTTPIDEQLAWLERIAPAYLATYPSNLHALLRESVARGVRLPGLRDVTVSSEHIPEGLGAACAQVWGARLVPTYSANEVGPIALGHPAQEGYLVQAESLLVEVLGDDDRPVPPGTVGRIVLTTLQDGWRPLIRYAIGDLGVAGPPTERGLPRLARVLGRERHLLTLADGRAMWPIFPIAELDAVPGLRQFQLVQTRVERLEARVVLDRELDPATATVLRGLLLRYLPRGLELELVPVPTIPRVAGKYVDFVNTLPTAGDEIVADGAAAR